MKRKLLLIVVFVFSSNLALASEFSQFLKSSAYGALIGAGVGVVSLAIENKPGQHISNIAKGASLGLYIGVGVGAYEAFKIPEAKLRQEYDFGSRTILVPKFAVNNGSPRLDGVELNANIFSF